MLIDLHVHTTRYSSGCSVLDPRAMVDRALAVGLDGVALAEHLGSWSQDELAALRGRGLKVFAAREVNMGDLHVLVYGLAAPPPPAPDAVALARAVGELGGAAVLAHPFRWGNWHRKPPQELAPIWGAFHAVEAFNGAMLPRERRAAWEVARALGLPVTGGSDAHALDEVGRCLTEFADDIADEAQLAAALRAGRCRGRPGPGEEGLCDTLA